MYPESEIYFNKPLSRRDVLRTGILLPVLLAACAQPKAEVLIKLDTPNNPDSGLSTYSFPANFFLREAGYIDVSSLEGLDFRISLVVNKVGKGLEFTEALGKVSQGRSSSFWGAGIEPVDFTTPHTLQAKWVDLKYTWAKLDGETIYSYSPPAKFVTL